MDWGLFTHIWPKAAPQRTSEGHGPVNPEGLCAQEVGPGSGTGARTLGEQDIGEPVHAVGHPPPAGGS